MWKVNMYINGIILSRASEVNVKHTTKSNYILTKFWCRRVYNILNSINNLQRLPPTTKSQQQCFTPYVACAALNLSSQSTSIPSQQNSPTNNLIRQLKKRNLSILKAVLRNAMIQVYFTVDCLLFPRCILFNMYYSRISR